MRNSKPNLRHELIFPQRVIGFERRSPSVVAAAQVMSGGVEALLEVTRVSMSQTNERSMIQRRGNCSKPSGDLVCS